ncbi:LuxR C-terminal-related transcriptional regulator [Rhizohabitans arisaemae]|uniref:LuxR C-terminal-related transcriptional regulator n=1 Tax=Rhizohabitans arisaemae TaxID=2720610 RepID=UPI0024B1C1D7|nr:response regulator transcription factor [Rhizohabitans arisaemae]
MVADESRLIHVALRAVLSRAAEFALAGAAVSVAEARKAVLQHRPEILLCEVEVAGQSGLELCRWARFSSPRTATVILTSHDDSLLAQSTMAAGASGYLLKVSPPEDLLFYLGRVATGQQVLDERVGRSRTNLWELDPQRRFGLSPRESEVLEEIVLGMDNRSIAKRLCIAHDTVKSHVKAILRKIGARDRAHAVALVLGARQRLVPGPRDPA